MTDAFKLQQFSEIDGCTSLVASKSSLLSPASTKPTADPFPTPKHDGKRAQGKYSCLRRELSMAIWSSVLDTVYVVTVVEEDSQTETQSQESMLSGGIGNRHYTGAC